MDETNMRDRRRTILLVDHEKEFRDSVGRRLTKQGFEVLHAAGPANGLELYFTHRPDAAVLDLAMPEMPGIEVLERIMENDSDFPVVVIAAGDELEEAVTALRLGACDCLGRDACSLDGLGEVLRRNIGEAEAVREKNSRIAALRREVGELNDVRRAYREKLVALTREKRSLSARLERKESRVEDMAVTLRTVIRTVDEDKREIRHSIADEIRSTVLPNLERLAEEESPEVRRSLRNVLEEQLTTLVDGPPREADDRLMILTATELAVAQYIKAGRTTAQIADLMHSSLETIQTHRKNLRKKYDLVGKNVDLQVYLRTIKGL